MNSELRITKLDPDAVLPVRSHEGDAGLDLVAIHDAEIYPGMRALVGTGIAVAIPYGTVGMVCPRSGLAIKHGITVTNAPGIVDAGYRGELKVNLLNTDANHSFQVKAGDRIAQLVIAPIVTSEFTVVDSLDEDTERSTNGFGSTG